MLIYSGPSELDGAPIVVIATTGSRNSKTGDMVQTWILRADVEPHVAIQTGEDASVCGDCPHRRSKEGTCYVLVHNAPLTVWRKYRRGGYADMSGHRTAVGAGRVVRLGSYGDPAAVPGHVWRELTAKSTKWAGYTHQWRAAAHLQPYCMASVDNPLERVHARAIGWRTFRVRTSDEPKQKGEFVCPASAEGGQKLQCAQCGACAGTSYRGKASPVIIAHGNQAKRFQSTRSSIT